MLVGDSGIWPDIAGIGAREEEWRRIEGWSMEEDKLRRFSIYRTI